MDRLRRTGSQGEARLRSRDDPSDKHDQSDRRVERQQADAVDQSHARHWK
jgi:hypothetical protein